MPHLLAETQLTTVPAYRLITLRDQDTEPAANTRGIIEQAQQTIAASTDDELYISCAQDLSPVTVTVHVWDSQPDTSQSLSSRLSLHCPSGQLVLGSPTGDAIGIELPHGPGTYSAVEYHRQLLAQLEATPSEPLPAPADRRPDTEHYLIHLWLDTPLPS
ncbi:hypothetical protein SAMN05216215_106151 [Saccharopolyspora shandongensis]|uniref:Uncharacterized protein n=1 Tax=Saccharopolyspora shandongensis TaxID=418495 RepID=A0A1H3S979_9PSEU|nr:hypothetical protein [Saccharopolyspora shandongensis]SDZ34220.1 hypothetical protein SAMN05216215_106151 [Saccharopolyspora shandongensis]